MSNDFNHKNAPPLLSSDQQAPLEVIHNVATQLLSIYEREYAYQAGWWLLEKVTGLSQISLIAQRNYCLSIVQKEQLQCFIQELIYENKPLAYILEMIPFGSLMIHVAPPTLIPRPETEEWILALLELLQQLPQSSDLRILDLCTGSGAIAALVAKTLPHAQVVASDISIKALELAEKNMRYNSINNVMLIQSDLFENLKKLEPFDLILSNPPYIKKSQWESLDASVRLWEDYQALVADDEGMAIIEKILAQAPSYTKKPQIKAVEIPQLVIEIGHDQKDQIIEKSNELYKCIVKKDLSNKNRVAYLYQK